MTVPAAARPGYPGYMAQDTDPQRDLNAGVDPEARAAARRWAREALADARRRFDPVAREQLRARLGLSPRPRES